MVWINLTNKVPFDKLNIRKAMNLAFPINQAINNIFHGYGKILKGIIPDFIQAIYLIKF